MTEHYVTLFDSLFLPQGLALHRSLQRHAGDHVLWILCVDTEVHDALRKLQLPNVRLLALDAVETAALREVKGGRSRGEYCWTLTPFTADFVFDADPQVRRVTYVDADVWLRRSPTPIFRELEDSGKAALITEHAYAPDYDASALSGQFCVQFMPFVRGRAAPVLRWWQERCIEWCFSRAEDGKLGDQKYLDVWPETFAADVHVLREKHLALGPWNATRFPFSDGVFYHFHGLRLTSERTINSGPYPLPRPLVDNVYRPYCDDLRQSIEQMRGLGLRAAAQAPRLGLARSIYRRLKPAYIFARTMAPAGSMSLYDDLPE